MGPFWTFLLTAWTQRKEGIGNLGNIFQSDQFAQIYFILKRFYDGIGQFDLINNFPQIDGSSWIIRLLFNTSWEKECGVRSCLLICYFWFLCIHLVSHVSPSWCRCYGFMSWAPVPNTSLLGDLIHCSVTFLDYFQMHVKEI